MPQPLDAHWLWPGLDDCAKSLVEHSALSEVLAGPPKPLLLPPYLLEFENFLSQLRAGLEEAVMGAMPSALATLDELTAHPQAQSLLQLAAAVGRERRELTPAELDNAVRFFETHAKDLVSLVRGRSEERRVGKECRSRWWA